MKKKSIERLDRKDKASHHKDISLDVPGYDENSAIQALREKEYDPNSEHPTPEQLLVREAYKVLTLKQRRVWELYNYDRLTHDEIAQTLNISRQMVGKHIRSIETKITKWMKANIGAYKLLKTDYEGLDR